MVLSQSSCLHVWGASAWGDLHLHHRLPRMHTRLVHRGQLRLEDQCRQKSLFLLDVLDDVAHLYQILSAYLGSHPLDEQLPNAVFSELVEDAIPNVRDCLGPLEDRTRN